MANPSQEIIDVPKISPDQISDYDAEYEQWLRSEQRVPDTCTWLLRSREYKTWSSSGASSILVYAGSGMSCPFLDTSISNGPSGLRQINDSVRQVNKLLALH